MQVLQESERVLVFEEHTIVGGLGTAILEFVNKNRLLSTPTIKRLGVNSEFPKTGDYPYMLSSLGLDAASIVQEVLACV